MNTSVKARLVRYIEEIYLKQFKDKTLEHFTYEWNGFKLTMYPTAIDFTSAMGKVHQIKWELDEIYVLNLTVSKYVEPRVVADLLKEYLGSLK